MHIAKKEDGNVQTGGIINSGTDIVIHMGDTSVRVDDTMKNTNRKYSKVWGFSTWAFIITVILMYSLISSDIKADEDKFVNQEINQSVLVTRDNLKEINIKLKNDSPSITSLEMRCIVTKKELGELYRLVQNNTELGCISWDKKQILWDVVQEIENKLVENNKNYQYHPNDYIHALLSAHAYIDSQLNDKVVLDNLTLDDHTKNKLGDWHVVSVHNDVLNSGYYGVVYRNDKTHQIVLANRGTEGGAMGVITDAFSRRQSDWNTNLKEIFIGQIIIGQQARNYQATAEAVEIANETGYRLSITGHSLGAWLAELSAFYCHAYFDYRHVKAVTFDSPGALPMMKRLQSNIKSRQTQVDLDDIEIVTYLANPNPVNSCNEHTGRVYRVEVEMACTDWVDDRLPDWIKKQAGDTIKGVLASEGHALTGIIAVFDPVTGKPKEYRRMADWPRVKYTAEPRDFSDQRNTAFNDILKGMDISWLASMVSVKAVDYIIGDTTLMTMIDFLLNLTKIDQEEYWAYFEYIDWEKEERETSELRSKLSFDNRFALIAKAKYREGDDLYILNPIKGSIDEYLYELDKYKNNLKSNENLPPLVKKQLDNLHCSFTIKGSNGKYQLVPKGGLNIEDIRQRTKRLLSVVSWNVLDILHNLGRDVQIVDNRIIKLSANLPLETAYYTGIRDKEEELKNKLREHQVVVISGAGGMGKSTLATKYGKDRKEQGWYVRWIKGTQIDEEFLKLAKELYIATENLHPEEVRNLVYKELEKLPNEKQILLIFDNIENEENIKQNLINLPNQATVIITARNGNLLSGIYPNVALKGFGKEEAIAYLKEAIGQNKSAAEKLLVTVGESPFRLSKVVAYLKSHRAGKTLDEFIREYEAIKKGHGQNEKIYPEIELLFGNLKEHSLEGWRLLKYLAYLDAEGVSVQLITHIMGQTKDELQKPINELERLSLINVITEGNQTILKVSHRIVQNETKTALAEEDKTQASKLLEKLISELGKILPFFDDSSQNFDGAAELIRHSKILIREIKKVNLTFESNMDWFSKIESFFWKTLVYKEDEDCRIDLLLDKIGSYYFYIVFDFEAAAYYWGELLGYQKSIHKENHADLADSLNNTGLAYWKLGGEKNIQKGLEYLEESLKMRKELFACDHFDVADSLNNVGRVYQEFGAEENIRKGLIYLTESLKMYESLCLGSHRGLADVLNNLGNAYTALKGEYLQLGLMYLEKSLEMRQELFSSGHPDIAATLDNIANAYQALEEEENSWYTLSQKAVSSIYEGLFTVNPVTHFKFGMQMGKMGVYIGEFYLKLGGTKNIQKGLRYAEDSLRMRQTLFPIDSLDVGQALNNAGNAYQAFGDQNKALEYYKQAYSIYADTLKDDREKSGQIKSSIELLQPNFFKEKGLRTILQEQDYLGGKKIGFECRWIISSRGEINETLILLKQKMQKMVLNNIFNAVDDYGWSKVRFIIGDEGVKGYMEKDYIKKLLEALNRLDDLKEMTNPLSGLNTIFKGVSEIDNENIELAQMLCFESMNLGIMKSEKKPYAIVESFTREYPELVKKIAEQHPEFFVDGSIVEASIRAMPDDQSFEQHIFEHVKYMGMEERRGDFFKTSGF